MTAVSSLDDRTTGAIRRAIAEASAGRLTSACEIGEAALRDGGDPAALNALLGMFRCRERDFQAAVRHLRPAHEARPTDMAVAVNLVSALVECGELEEALAIASPERVAADTSLQLARYRGYVAQLTGDTATAAEAFDAVVRATPSDWQSWNNLGNARLLAGDSSAAVTAFRRSLELQSDQLPTWLNLSRALAKNGQLEEAERQLRQTAECFPTDAQALKELHDLMRRRDCPDELVHKLLEEAIARAPRDRSLLLPLGQHRMLANQIEGAEQAFRAVFDIDPADGEAYLELARLYEHTAPDRLESLVAEAAERAVPAPTLNLIKAFAARRSKHFVKGIASLKHIPDDFEPWLTNELRGQFFDKVGDYEAAFAAFGRMNEAQAADPSDPLSKAARVRTALATQLERLTGESLGGSHPGRSSSGCPAPVFLVGFPRSGTTLLDTMLMGHPDVTVMEESPILDVVSRQIGGLDGIPTLDPHGIRAARDRYFELATRYSDPGRKLLIDKNPLHLARVPLIHRLFPDARYILALRHPADAILSCYFTNFRLTAVLANFLRLDTAAEYYDLIWRMWMRSRDLIDLDVSIVRYENLVTDPEAELRPVAKKLGLEWRDDLLDHQGTAALRPLISSASYAQVTEPLYLSSIDRWKRYRRHLEPILPAVQPWIDDFGYSV